MTNETGTPKLITVTIDIPETIVVNSRKQACMVETALLPLTMIARAVVHGITQKVADAASGASGEAAANALGEDASKGEVKEWTMAPANLAAIQALTCSSMEAARDKLEAGQWVIARKHVSLDPVMELAMKLADADICRNLVARDGNAKALTGLAKADRRAKVSAYMLRVSDVTDYIANAETELARRAAVPASDTLSALGL